MIDSAGTAFLKRARYEAARYGSDPWVFVRELLQNARDAGAHRVWFETSSGDGCERISCRDDGSGMTFQHAQRYLFSLYASSKTGQTKTAGKFGIGFWSVLRFDPTEIVVGSRTSRGEGWQVRLDGRLETTRREAASIDRGTEVVLERPATGIDLDKVLKEAILRDAPFLNCRDRAEHPLEVRVDGNLVRTEPKLPPPSLSFRRRGLRGVVGLGAEPRAEVFAHGFRVRDAATLDELLVERKAHGPVVTSTAGGLAPQVIIDSRELEVLMARGDAKEDRALQRLVAVGHRELSRLVRGELDRHAHLSAPARLMERLRESWTGSTVVKVSALAILIVALVLVGLWSLSKRFPVLEIQTEPAVEAISTAPPVVVAYRDLWRDYRGPDVDGLGNSSPTVDLRYRPADTDQLLAALWITGLNADGVPLREQHEVAGRYVGRPCVENCLEIELGIDAERGPLRVPIATGHLLDPGSVRLEGERLAVVAMATGQPAVWLDGPRKGRLSYRTSPGESDIVESENRWPPLPQEFAEFSQGLDAKPPSSLAFDAAEYVGRHVAYDTSSNTVARHRQARDESMMLFDRAAAIGAGDCDVQNSLVAAMLDHAGVSARLAIGWVGTEGRALTGLHAWTEYRDVNGRWRAVDASAVEAGRSQGREPALPSDKQLTRTRIGAPLWTLGAAATVLAAVIAAAVVGARRWRRSVRVGKTDDVVGLMRGAAIRPYAFEGIHSLFTRRLLPLVSGRSISLRRAQKTAKLGRLACGSSRSELARRAAEAGGTVLDMDRPECVVVADALAAVDLDRWQEMLDRAESNDLTILVEARLRSAGEPCVIGIADNIGAEISVLDGAVFGLGGHERWVVVGTEGETWKSVVDLAGRWPARAALVLADHIVHRTGAPPAVRHRCLSGLASDAILEAAAEVT